MAAVLWFTGLSGSGKTTLARALATQLQKEGKIVTLLDGDDVRDGHEKRLGFSREDIRENNRRLAVLAKEKSVDADFVLVSAISPYAEDRKNTRETLGDAYVEIFVDTPLAVCIERDVKGLYKKGQAGEIDIIGMSEKAPYERPVHPDVTVLTVGKSFNENMNELIGELQSRGLLDT